MRVGATLVEAGVSPRLRASGRAFTARPSVATVRVRALLLAAVVVCNGSSAFADSPAADLLNRAFRNRYDVDTAQRIALTVRNRAGSERGHVVEIATKRIDGQLHSLGRFIQPPDLRGTSILIIENQDRSDDHFVYFPYLEKVRRIGSSQRADAFMGTDLTYEDLERRYARDYDIVKQSPETLDDEDVVLIFASPKYDSGYAIAEFAIATSDFAILRIRYFKESGAIKPSKILRAPRSGMSRIDGHTLPRWMEVTDLRRRTTTEVRVDHIDVNPVLPDELFTAVSLQLRKRIPFADGSREDSGPAD